jgi:hypothetical protein
MGDTHTTRESAAVKHRYVIGTTGLCILFGVLGHLTHWIHWSPWGAFVGVSLVGVALTAFGGFYLLALRARIAIAASFLMTFLVALSYALTIPEFAQAASGDGARLVDDFRTVVIAVVGFYFGSETVVSATKILGVTKAGGDSNDIKSADRDMAVVRGIDR